MKNTKILNYGEAIKVIGKGSYFKDDPIHGQLRITGYEIRYKQGLEDIADMIRNELQAQVPADGLTWVEEFRIALTSVHETPK